MSKIDIDKFVVSLFTQSFNKPHDGMNIILLHLALRDQGLCYKDGEIIELSNLEQNGKECKPANFAKSSKDLQELTESNRILAEDLLLTDFGKEVEDMVLYISKHPNGLIGGVKGYSFRKIPSLYSLAVKQFKQDQMNQELTEFEKAVQSVLYTEITNALNNDPYVVTVDKIKQASKMLLDKARKYYNEKSIDDMLQWGLLD